MLRHEQLPGAGRTMLGSRLFARLGRPERLSVGGRNFAVGAVLDPTGDEDDDSAFLALADLQKLVGWPGVVSSVEVASGCIACRDMDVYDHAREIQQALLDMGQDGIRVQPLRQVAEAQIGTLTMVERVAWGLFLLIALLGGLLVGNDLLARVHEQRRELALLRAMGMSRSRLAGLLLARAAVVGVTGSVLGTILGVALVLVFGPAMVGEAAAPALLPVLLMPVLACAIALLAGLLPALKGARLQLSAALAEER